MDFVLSGSAMDTAAQPSQDHDFGNFQWVEIGNEGAGVVYNHHPLLQYHQLHRQQQHHSSLIHGDGFAYGPSLPPYSIFIPPPYATPQPELPMAMPSQPPRALFPQPSYVTAPSITAPSSISTTAGVQSTHTSGPTSRRTLTNEERRNICLYREENPQAKQTEIGAQFGVERSTVSKILRQRERYLFPGRSPIKRSKDKLPNIEKALSNWVRNHQRCGLPLDDATIRKKAIFFAKSVGDPRSKQRVLDSDWLEDFKQRNDDKLC